jgi:hypothetical protein
VHWPFGFRVRCNVAQSSASGSRRNEIRKRKADALKDRPTFLKRTDYFQWIQVDAVKTVRFIYSILQRPKPKN